MAKGKMEDNDCDGDGDSDGADGVVRDGEWKEGYI